jgi:DNA topoisomerase-1
MKYLLTYNEKKSATKDADKKFEPQKVYSDAEIKKRWEKKRAQIKHLSKNIRKFKITVDKDLSSSDEKTRIIATIAKIIEITAERVGNDESSNNGHYGVSNLTSKHIKVNGDNITLKYIGKSGVEHEKSFSHAKVAKNLKELLKRKTNDIFSTSEGQSIKNTQVNNYLAQFNITSKDLRGYKSNKLMTTELRKLGKVKDEKDRKTKFNELLKKVASEIGHLPGTLRKHYLLPEIESNFYSHGSIGRVQKI